MTPERKPQKSIGLDELVKLTEETVKGPLDIETISNVLGSDFPLPSYLPGDFLTLNQFFRSHLGQPKGHEEKQIVWEKDFGGRKFEVRLEWDPKGKAFEALALVRELSSEESTARPDPRDNAQPRLF